MPNAAFEPGDDICPPWWPQIIWSLHFPRVPHGGKPPPPVNYPPAIDDIMSSLAIHTFSYLMSDQKAAQNIRNVAEEKIAATAKQLSQLHNKAIGK